VVVVEPRRDLRGALSHTATAAPPQLYFVGSALFHYLGPAFAVLLFARVEPLGVAWLRIASAAAIFALWRRPWRALVRSDRAARQTVVGLAVVFAAMNVCFYVAIDRLPLGTVAAIEFLPVIALAALGARTGRNAAALGLAVIGVYLLTDVRLGGEPVGLMRMTGSYNLAGNVPPGKWRLAYIVTTGDVNTEEGTLTVRNVKFHKDRLVPMHPSLVERCRVYKEEIHPVGQSEDIFFPSSQDGRYSERVIYAYFRRFLWDAGISHWGRGKGPRVHDLRHAFAVHCLKRWVQSGVDLTVSLPYLSVYLGHAGLKGSQRYLRLTAELYPDIARAMDERFGHILPGER
jgi:hypothetical protein